MPKSNLPQVIEPLPKEAFSLASEIRKGTPTPLALKKLKVSPETALSWLKHPDWQEVITSETNTSEYIKSQKAMLVEQALRVKDEILFDDSYDPKLRNSVASEILESFSPTKRISERVIFVLKDAEEDLFNIALKEILGE